MGRQSSTERRQSEYTIYIYIYRGVHARAPLARAYRSLAGLLMHRWVLYFERKLAGVRGSVLVA